MDQVLAQLIGKAQLNPAKIITITAENFSLHEDQAKFLKTILSVPKVKQLPLNHVTKRFIQLGRLHSEVKSFLDVDDDNWLIDEYHENEDTDRTSLVERISSDLLDGSAALANRTLVFINDASKLSILSHGSHQEQRKFLRMVDKLKRSRNHFILLLYQQSQPCSDQTFLRDLEFISDACIRNRSYKSCYMQSIWFQPIPTQKVLIPPKVETNYYTCRISKFEFSPKLLCFRDQLRVTKNHDPDAIDLIMDTDKGLGQTECDIERMTFAGDEEGEGSGTTSTLPYIRAQDPEQSRIFYYPDKDDDIDDEDPDNDLDL